MAESKHTPGTTYTRLAAVREPNDERRRARRVSVQLPATFATVDLEMDVELEVIDVSAGGLFVRSDFLEPSGTEVRLSVALGDRRVDVRGKVAWVAETEPRGPGMGIELDEASRDRWLAAGVPKIA